MKVQQKKTDRTLKEKMLNKTKKNKQTNKKIQKYAERKYFKNGNKSWINLFHSLP